MTVFLAFAAASALILLLVATGLFPRTKWGTKESSNGLGHVHMHDLAYYAQTDQSPRGVLAQERGECLLKWLVRLLLVGLGVFIGQRVGGDTGAVVGVLPGFLAATLLSSSPAYFRQIELMGHTCEIVVAPQDGFTRTEYLKAEAGRTIGNTADYGRAFPGWTQDKLEAAFRRRIFAARLLTSLLLIKLPKERGT